MLTPPAPDALRSALSEAALTKSVNYVHDLFMKPIPEISPVTSSTEFCSYRLTSAALSRPSGVPYLSVDAIRVRNPPRPDPDRHRIFGGIRFKFRFPAGEGGGRRGVAAMDRHARIKPDRPGSNFFEAGQAVEHDLKDALQGNRRARHPVSIYRADCLLLTSAHDRSLFSTSRASIRDNGIRPGTSR
jgi:hypothetical protein